MKTKGKQLDRAYVIN